MISCAIWGGDWANRTATVHCDNLGVVSLVNSEYIRVPQIMHLLRCLFFSSEHVFSWRCGPYMFQGCRTILRNNLDLFLLQVPEATHHRRATCIPPELLELLVGQQPDWTSQAWSRLFTCSFPLALPPRPGGTI